MPFPFESWYLIYLMLAPFAGTSWGILFTRAYDRCYDTGKDEGLQSLLPIIDPKYLGIL